MKTTKKILIITTTVILIAVGLFMVVENRSVSSWKTLNTELYEVKIPDGWIVIKGVSSNSITDADCVSCIIHKPGKRAEIMTGSGMSINKDVLYPFLLAPESNLAAEDDFFKDYDKTGSIQAKNATGNMYYKKVTELREMGFYPGTQLYGYAIAKDDNIILIRYAHFAKHKNQQKVLEDMVATLELK